MYEVYDDDTFFEEFHQDLWLNGKKPFQPAATPLYMHTLDQKGKSIAGTLTMTTDQTATNVQMNTIHHMPASNQISDSSVADTTEPVSTTDSGDETPTIATGRDCLS